MTVKTAAAVNSQVSLLRAMGFKVTKHYKINGGTDYVAERGDEVVIIRFQK